MSSNEKPLLPVYLFNGEDQLKQETLLKRLSSRIGSITDIEMNSTNFQPADIKNADQLLDACYTLPFGSAVRLVTVKDADKLAQPILDALANYVAEPSDTTVLVLMAQKLKATTRFFKALKKHYPEAIIDCSPKKRSELPALVRSMAVAQGVTISTDAAVLLIERAGTSTIALNTELQKLTSYIKASKRETISRQDIIAVVARVAEVKPWDLADALTARDSARSLQLIARMPDQSAPSLLGICVSRVRELLSIKALKQRDVSSIAAELGQPDWRVRNQIKAAPTFSRRMLIDSLTQAAEVDRQMKSGGDATLLLEQWLITFCTQKR